MKKNLLLSLGAVLSLAAPSFAAQPDAFKLWQIHSEAVLLSGRPVNQACIAIPVMVESIQAVTKDVGNPNSLRGAALSRLGRRWKNYLSQFCDGTNGIYGENIYKVNDRNLHRVLALISRECEIVLAVDGAVDDVEPAIWDAYGIKLNDMGDFEKK